MILPPSSNRDDNNKDERMSQVSTSSRRSRGSRGGNNKKKKKNNKRNKSRDSSRESMPRKSFRDVLGGKINSSSNRTQQKESSAIMPRISSSQDDTDVGSESGSGTGALPRTETVGPGSPVYKTGSRARITSSSSTLATGQRSSARAADMSAQDASEKNQNLSLIHI